MFDCNAFIGEWAFRKLPYNTADGLLKLMDKVGIERALVSSLHAVTFKDCNVANRMLFESIASFRDRLLPCGTINPAFPGWEHDLRACFEAGCVAIKFLPLYHAYSPLSPAFSDALQASIELGMNCIVIVLLEDLRMKHWLLNLELPDWNEWREFVTRPPAMLIIGGLTTHEALQLSNNLNRELVAIETSRAHTGLLPVDLLVEHFGDDNVILGTGMPLLNPFAIMLAMKRSRLPRNTLCKIATQNFATRLPIGHRLRS
ncbi:MAG TPA: hypothetical protein EYP10_05680 [Armatimonadetes bacterium]|nr:hypothetical protein [Armatimonadota bacterium]